jgi:hypothetical protein
MEVYWEVWHPSMKEKKKQKTKETNRLPIFGTPSGILRILPTWCSQFLPHVIQGRWGVNVHIELR